MRENEHTEVLAMLNENGFVQATVAQINKDLQGLHEELNLTGDNNASGLDQLTALLQPALLKLSNAQPELLSQFIYKVDLNEKKFILSISSDLSLNHLAFLVIEREALKVWLRLKFR